MSQKTRRSTLGRILPLIAILLITAAALNARTYRSIFHSNQVNGGHMDHGVTLDAAGNLYGTTTDGGPLRSEAGLVFKLSEQPDGTWAESILHIFTAGSDGANPSSGVVFDQNGNLYGMTLYGGIPCATDPRGGCGTVYKLAPQPDGSWKHTVIYAFGDDDGIVVSGELTFDAAGNLYGITTGYSSTNCCGVVFRLKPNSAGSWSEDILYAFTGGKDGSFPVGNLQFDVAGNLYGETVHGGAHDCGTVFKLTPNSGVRWSQTVLHNFCASSSDGETPSGGLTLDAAGNLFGVTFWGGGHTNSSYCSRTGCGTVFELIANSDGSRRYRKIHSFTGTPGISPHGGLAVDSAGTLYGTTALGGGHFGSIFKLVPNLDGSWTAKTLHLFKTYPAFYPISTMVLDKSGTLFGTTYFSRPEPPGTGVVFEMVP